MQREVDSRPSLWSTWPVMILTLISLALIGTIGGCTSVEHDVDASSSEALDDTGLSGVEVVEVAYRNVTLRGPDNHQDAALDAVHALASTREVRYESTGEVEATTDTTVAGTGVTVGESTTSTAAVAIPTIALDGTVQDDVVTLTGVVPDEATRRLLVDQAIVAYGEAAVVDQLSLGAVPASPELTAAAGGLAGLFPVFQTSLPNGAFRLLDTALTVTGTADSAEAASSLTAALGAATGFSAVDHAIEAQAEPEPNPVEDEIAAVLALQGITFETGSAEITEEGQGVLDEIGAILSEGFSADETIQIEIGGHTDSEGDDEINQELSQARADAVAAYLVEAGLPEARFTTEGYGESEPIADNETSEGRAANRRIEFTIVEG